MKEELRFHISEIFRIIGIDAPFEIYEYGVDIQPLLAQAIGLHRQYLICSTASSYKDRLELMLGKTLNAENGIIRWTDGGVIDAEVEKNAISRVTAISAHSQPVSGMPSLSELYKCSYTKLPNWLDQRIFDKMGCSYAPSGTAKEFNRNLELSLAMIKKYLGTYLPRSYAESFCIFDNLFSNPTILKAYVQKRNMKTLCVGSGTGGDTLGFLEAVDKHFPNVTTVQVTAIEGNSDASSISAALVEEAKDHMHFSIDFQTVKHVFTSFESIDDKLKDYCKASDYDFVFTSKMINELVSSGHEGTLTSYGNFARSFLPLLKPKGLLLLNDITSKPDPIDAFVPILMNEQVNQVLRSTGDFQTILPIPCGLYEDLCNRDCFTQKSYFVTHSRKQGDKSKVCFRVIARTKFATEVLSNASDEEDVSYIKDEEKKECCPFSPLASETADGFALRASDTDCIAVKGNHKVEHLNKAIMRFEENDPVSSANIQPTVAAVEDTWRDVLTQLFDESALEYAKHLILLQVKAPSIIGFELLDTKGAVICEAEMVWEDEKIAVVLPHQLEGKVHFEQQGWTAISIEDEFPLTKGGDIRWQLQPLQPKP